jgi:hypothetical protein
MSVPSHRPCDLVFPDVLKLCRFYKSFVGLESCKRSDNYGGYILSITTWALPDECGDIPLHVSSASESSAMHVSSALYALIALLSGVAVSLEFCNTTSSHLWSGSRHAVTYATLLLF